MTDIFLQIIQMSISAGYVILAVLLCRLVLIGAPKKFSYALWSVVAFRLLCPFSFGSVLSVFNLHFGSSENAIVDFSGVPAGQSEAEGSSVNTGIPVLSAAQEAAPAHSAVTAIDILAWIWLIGIAALLAYGIISYVRLKHKMQISMTLKDNIRQADIRSPFILGFLKPTIYLPFGLDPEVEDIAIAHESCHIRRKDPIIKMLSFALLILHWFNPLCWLAFYEMEKDMEMSCDEYVLSQYEDAQKRYSLALLSFSMGKKFSLASPLAFGENNIKERIVNAMKYKRVSKLLTIAAVLVCALTIVACGTNGMTVSADTEGTAAEATEATAAAETSAAAEADEEFQFENVPIDPEEGTLTSGYGYRSGKKHEGVDFAAEEGTPIYAVADGKATIPENPGGFGKTVMIDHGNGYITFYAHCASIDVNDGAQVKAGDQIATVGKTGKATGEHLHLELRKADGSTVDPEPYYEAANK